MHHSFRIWSAARSALCRGGRRLSAEAGDTLIEVVIAAVILVLISIASLTGFDVANRSSADQKRHTQADQLAQQDQDRLRGLQVAQLTSTPGNQTKSYTLDGTTFSVASTSFFVSDTTGGSSCTTSGTNNADYVKTTSTVTWAGMAPRTPVVEEGIITPPAGGSMLVQTTDQTNANLSGVSIVVTGTGAGTTPSSTATTDSNGCAIFGGLVDGAYSLTTTDPGFVDPSGNPSPTSAQTVVAGATDTAPVTMGKATSITATYQTFWNGTPATPRATTQDTFVASQIGLPAPGFRVFGTAGVETASLNSGTTIFPFTSPYSTYVGSCTGDDPVNNGQATDPTAAVTPGGAATPVTLTAPGLFIQAYSGTSGTTAMVGYPSPSHAASSVPNRVTVTDNNCGDKQNITTGLLAPNATTGVLPDPGEPYGSFTACAEYTIRSGSSPGYTYTTKHQSAIATNKVTAGTTVPLYFGTPLAGACP